MMPDQPTTTVHPERHPYANRVVLLSNNAQDPLDRKVVPGTDFVVLDWADRCFGSPWRTVRYPVTGAYAVRVELAELPIDDEVVYGRIGSTYYLVHETELGGLA
jgi:hypothetical protein